MSPRPWKPGSDRSGVCSSSPVFQKISVFIQASGSGKFGSLHDLHNYVGGVYNITLAPHLSPPLARFTFTYRWSWHPVAETNVLKT